MDARGSCRRCSVTRVNALCRLYEEGFGGKDARALKKLKSLVGLARTQGYGEGERILHPHLPEEVVRKTCWNISSVLTDSDFRRYGVNVDGRGRTAT